MVDKPSRIRSFRNLAQCRRHGKWASEEERHDLTAVSTTVLQRVDVDAVRCKRDRAVFKPAPVISELPLMSATGARTFEKRSHVWVWMTNASVSGGEPKRSNTHESRNRHRLRA